MPAATTSTRTIRRIRTVTLLAKCARTDARRQDSNLTLFNIGLADEDTGRSAGIMLIRESWNLDEKSVTVLL